MQEGGGENLSMQLRWRSVALQALHAYMAAMHAKDSQADTSSQVCVCSKLCVYESSTRIAASRGLL
jgi:hypothetical protein